MMRSRRIILVNERQSSAASSLDDRALLLPQNANESDYAYPLPGMILSDKRDNDSFSSAENPYGNPYDLSARFNPSMAIIIVVLLSAFFFMGFFSIYVRRCTSEEENQGGNSRRGGGGNRRMNRAPQGLDRTLIESFPVFSYSLVKGLKKGKESLECAVCLSEFEDDETLRLLPKCGHAFHPDCIDMWLFSHTTCPLCRSSLLPDSTAAEEGLMVNIEGQAHQDPLQAAEQVVIVVGPGNPEQDRVDQQGRGLNELNPFDAGVPVTSSGRASGVHNEPSSSGSPILGLVNGLRPLENRSKNFRRSHSTGHSLVRLRGNPEHPSELYISTDDRYVLDFTEGLIGSSAKAGLHRSSSCAAFSHSGSKEFSNLGFSDDTERLWRYPSSTESTRVLEAYAHFYHQPGIVTETETDRELARLSETRFDPRIKSDRWSMSVHSPVFLRTFSDSRAPYFQQQQAPIFSTSHEIMQQDRKAYLQYVKKSFKWLRGRDKRMSSNNMQGASRVSSRNAEQGGSLAYVLTVR